MINWSMNNLKACDIVYTRIGAKVKDLGNYFGINLTINGVHETWVSRKMEWDLV